MNIIKNGDKMEVAPINENFTELDDRVKKVESASILHENLSNKNKANGYAGLNEQGKIDVNLIDASGNWKYKDKSVTFDVVSTQTNYTVELDDYLPEYGFYELMVSYMFYIPLLKHVAAKYPTEFTSYRINTVYLNVSTPFSITDYSPSSPVFKVQGTVIVPRTYSSSQRTISLMLGNKVDNSTARVSLIAYKKCSN